jgi:hypothetical protein
VGKGVGEWMEKGGKRTIEIETGGEERGGGHTAFILS